MSSSTRRVANGLPSNPRAVRLAGPVTSVSGQSERPRAPSSISQYRSIGPEMGRDIGPNRGDGARRMDSRERAYPSYQQGPSEVRNPRLSSASSSTSSSASSEPSTFWARDYSRASSRTTIRSDDNGEDFQTESKQSTTRSNVPQTSSSFAEPEYSYVWNRVTEVASVLTQEVSRVWASGLGTGNENFIEDDEHLNRVMRAYHLSKAKTPQELPDWLFSERERGQGGRFDLHNNGKGTTTAAQEIKGIDNYQREQRFISLDKTTKHSENQSMAGHAKLSGTERLKQMRNMKRTAPSNRF